MNYYMKMFVYLILFQLVSLLGISQIESSSLKILETILRTEHPDEALYYTDKLDSGIISWIKESLQKRKFIGQTSYTAYDKIRLSRKEKKYLDSCINKLYSFSWEDSLFENSKRIPNDSVYAHINKKNREFSKLARDATETGAFHSINNRVKFSNTFQFSFPIYFRDKSVFMVFFIRLCGSECGVQELAFYRLKDEGYKKWFNINSSVY